jgi:DivIVA domain-containing protein
MELTPQALHDVEFREARRGGYNTRDVDDFLERVAVGIGQLQDRLREAYHRAEAAEGRLADMQRQLDDLQRRGVPAPSPVQPVQQPHEAANAGGGGGDADETLRRTLVLAQRTADATIKEAKDEAARLLGEARDEAAHIRSSAETDAMRDAQAEVDHLNEAREALLHDVEALEQHLDEQRNRVRGSLDELQRLLDEPNAFRATPAPAVTDISRQPGPPPLDSRERDHDRDRDREREPLPPAPPLPPKPSLPPEPAMPSSNGGGFVPKGGQVTIPAPPVDPPAAASGHFDLGLGRDAELDREPGRDVRDAGPGDDERVPPSNAGSLNDGAMVAALQELHGSSPRDPLPSRGDDARALPREPFGPVGAAVPPEPAGHEPFDALPSLPARGEAPPPPAPEPFDALPSLPSRGEAPSVPPVPPVHEPFESLPSLPSRGEAPSVPPVPPVHEPFESLPSLPSRGDAGITPSPGREPLPSRGAGGGGREPLLASNAGGPEPLNFPPPTPGTTGFLPDLNAAFNPPPPPDDLGPLAPPSPPAGGPAQVDDLGPIDAPPPPPPPPGFEHLHEVGGIPIEPGSRPSEWGRGVFDPEDELDGQSNNGARFGRRR